jgi:hypothetical protein
MVFKKLAYSLSVTFVFVYNCCIDSMSPSEGYRKRRLDLLRWRSGQSHFCRKT